MRRNPRAGRLLRVLAAAVLVLAAGCTNADSGRVTLVFWSWVPGIEKAVKEWNSQNREIKVDIQRIPSGNQGGYAKMFSALEADGAPDVAQVEYWEIPAFLLEGGLVELGRHGARQHAAKFVPWQWQQGEFQGGIYAIPQASGPLAMYYRADLFSKWGIEPPTTWAAYEQAARKIKQADPSTRIGTFPPNNAQWFIALAWQAGARWFGAREKWSVNIDDGPTRQVASYWDRLYREDLVQTIPDSQTGWYKQIHDGKIVAWVGPQWGDALITKHAKNSSGKWRVAPMPQWDPAKPASANWGGSSTAVLRGTPHADEALKFAVWLNTDRRSVDILIDGGYGWPAASGLDKGSELDKPDPFFGGQRYNDVFAASDKQIDTTWRWPPTTAALLDTISRGFADAVAGRGSFLSTVRDTQQATESDMRRKGLEVEERS